jgi:hypothetical protein
MRSSSPLHALVALVSFLALADSPAAPQPDTRLRYLVLSATPEAPPPFAAVDFVYGPQETMGRRDSGGRAEAQWWQVEIRTNAELSSTPACVLRALTSADPLAGRPQTKFHRYQLRIPENNEALEYVDVHSGQALLPAWVGFESQFVPRPAPASVRQRGAPQTCELLGHVLSLHAVRHDGAWSEWSDVRRLELDREVLVGTGRNFKDTEGRRLPQTPQPQNYTYTNFTGADYRAMIDAGINLFRVAPEQQQYIQAEPVFYLRSTDGTPALRYPADLYRANYLGAAMFVDEPASILTWDKYVAGKLNHFSDAAVLIEQRTRATFDSARRHYGRYWLGEQLSGLGVNFGDMRLAQVELPVWETYYDTAFYEMKGGGSGIVHEGRYQLNEFDEAMFRATGARRAHTAREMFQWHYAFLRGGASPFGKSWGTSIYGQCDPAIAAEALTTAYDLGARYFWFWTSDHGHHVPWPEQLELARTLKRHVREHARSSIFGPQRKTHTVITLPEGSFATYAELPLFQRLDKEGMNEESQDHRRLRRRLVEAVEQCFRRGEDFEITIAEGQPIKGYRRVVKLSEKE